MKNKYVKVNEIFAIIPKSRKNIKIVYKNGKDFYSVETDNKLNIKTSEFKNVLIKDKIRMSYDAYVFGEEEQKIGTITKLFSLNTKSFSASLPDVNNKSIKVIINYLEGTDKEPYILKEDLVNLQKDYNNSLKEKNKEIIM